MIAFKSQIYINLFSNMNIAELLCPLGLSQTFSALYGKNVFFRFKIHTVAVETRRRVYWICLVGQKLILK